MDTDPSLVGAMRQYHDATLDSLHAIIRLHDFILKYDLLPHEQRSALSANGVYQEYLLPLFRCFQKLCEGPGIFSDCMAAARLAIGRDFLTFRNMSEANAHNLVFGMCTFFIRLWNRRARPSVAEIPPSVPISTPHKIVLFTPSDETQLNLFLNEACLCLREYNPFSLQAELQVEYVKAIELLQPASASEPNDAKADRGDQKSSEGATGTPQQTFVFSRAADGYYVAGFDEGGFVPTLLGFQYIERLISAPGQPVQMIELVGGPGDSLHLAHGHSEQNAITAEGKQKIKEELSDLDRGIEKAKRDNDYGELERLQRAKEELISSLKRDLGLGGKSRNLNNPADKLRPRIQGTLNTAYKKLRAYRMEKLADHFSKNIRADRVVFVYDPASAPPWSFEKRLQ